jgi:hypothetical protein
VERDELFVPRGARLPGTCLKCGARNDPKGRVIRRRETLYEVNTTTGLLGGLGGAGIAQAMRMFPDAAATILIGSVVVVTPVLWLMHRRTPHQEVELPLCTSCDARWRQGVLLRRAFAGAMLGGLGLGGAFFYAGTVPLRELAVGGAVAFVLLLLAAVTARLPARFVTASRVRPEAIWLKGVDAAALSRLGKPRRAGKP